MWGWVQHNHSQTVFGSQLCLWTARAVPRRHSCCINGSLGFPTHAHIVPDRYNFSAGWINELCWPVDLLANRKARKQKPKAPIPVSLPFIWPHFLHTPAEGRSCALYQQTSIWNSCRNGLGYTCATTQTPLEFCDSKSASYIFIF